MQRVTRLKRELILDLADGDTRSQAELSDGRSYISVVAALKRLQRDGIVEMWLDDFNYPTRPRRMVRLSETAAKALNP